MLEGRRLTDSVGTLVFKPAPDIDKHDSELIRWVLFLQERPEFEPVDWRAFLAKHQLERHFRAAETH